MPRKKTAKLGPTIDGLIEELSVPDSMAATAPVTQPANHASLHRRINGAIMAIGGLGIGVLVAGGIGIGLSAFHSNQSARQGGTVVAGTPAQPGYTMWVGNTGGLGACLRAEPYEESKLAKPCWPDGRQLIVVGEETNGYTRVIRPAEGYVPSKFLLDKRPVAVPPTLTAPPTSLPSPPIFPVSHNARFITDNLCFNVDYNYYNGRELKYLQFYNASPVTLDIGQWYFSSGTEFRFVFPDTVQLVPGSSVRVVALPLKKTYANDLLWEEGQDFFDWVEADKTYPVLMWTGSNNPNCGRNPVQRYDFRKEIIAIPDLKLSIPGYKQVYRNGGKLPFEITLVGAPAAYKEGQPYNNYEILVMLYQTCCTGPQIFLNSDSAGRITGDIPLRNLPPGTYYLQAHPSTFKTKTYEGVRRYPNSTAEAERYDPLSVKRLELKIEN